jgi:hypothetical protein
MQALIAVGGIVACLPGVIGNNAVDGRLGLARTKVDPFSANPLFHHFTILFFYRCSREKRGKFSYSPSKENETR